MAALVLTVALQLAAVYVPFFQRVLRTTALPPSDLLLAFAAGASVLLAVEAWKWVVRRRTTARVTSDLASGSARPVAL
jgi:Ca2+-transporting ATPase